MIVKLLGRGRSFRGVWQYHFHDKRSNPDQPHPMTYDRVQYAGTINLATQNPGTAWKMMAFTCKISSYLKDRAGLSNRGRKCTHPVLPVLISYGEGQSPALYQIKGDIDAVLAILGLLEHESIWAVHNDTNNLHTHLLINTVHPQTGMAAQFTKQHASTLQDWAAKREQEWGNVQCQRRQPERPTNSKSSKQSDAERMARRRIGNNLLAITEANAIAGQIRSEWAAYYQEKRALDRAHKESLAAIYADAKKARASVKAATASMIRSVYKYNASPLVFIRPWFHAQAWKRFSKRISAARRLFRSRERSMSGIFLNAAMLALSDYPECRSFIDLLLNRNLRTQCFERWVANEAEKIKNTQRESKDKRVNRIRHNEHKTYCEISLATKGNIEQEMEIHAVAMKRMNENCSILKREARGLWEELGIKADISTLKSSDYHL